MVSPDLNREIGHLIGYVVLVVSSDVERGLFLHEVGHCPADLRVIAAVDEGHVGDDMLEPCYLLPVAFGDER